MALVIIKIMKFGQSETHVKLQQQEVAVFALVEYWAVFRIAVGSGRVLSI